MAALWTFARDEEGGVSILAAAGSVMVLCCAAMAVDGGAVFLESRRLQGIADLAAIAAARDIGNAQAAARATVDANKEGAGLALAVITGVYTPSPGIAHDQRFVATAASPTAARVEVTGKAPQYFSPIFNGGKEGTIVRKATAARAELASFSIGTRLASLQGGVANDLLTGLTGSQVNLSVMDYNALVDADVELFDYMDALRTSVGLEAATFSEVLSADITTGQALQALSNTLAAGGDAKAAGAVHTLAVAAGTGTKVDLSLLFNLGPYGAQDHVAGASNAEIRLAALDAAQAVLMLAGEGRQVKLDAGATVPGLADLDVWLAIGERPNNAPWMTVGRDGSTTIRTAQMRLYVEAKALSSLGLLGLKPVTLPLVVEAASAQAKLSAISCTATHSARSAKLSVMPSLGRVSIGQVDTAKLNNFKQDLAVKPATIIDLALIQATGSAKVDIGGGAWQEVSFSHADIAGGTIKSVSTNDISQATSASLLKTLNLQVQVGGLGLNLGGVTSALSGTLGVIAPILDQYINALTDVLGVKLGTADVRVSGLRCHDAALVG